MPVTIVEGDEDKYDAFAAARAALACSGTIAIELAMAGLPAVIAYKVSPLTAFLYRRLIKVKYANLVNIMHDRMVVPELLQDKCKPEKIAAALHVLFTDEAARQRQIVGLANVAGWLGAGQFVPGERAAKRCGVAGKTPVKPAAPLRSASRSGPGHRAVSSAARSRLLPR